jgi:hypothetical protein
MDLFLAGHAADNSMEVEKTSSRMESIHHLFGTVCTDGSIYFFFPNGV